MFKDNNFFGPSVHTVFDKKIIIGSLLSIILVGCGDGKTNDTAAPSNDISNTEKSGLISTSAANLSTESISRDALFGLTPAKIIEPAPCPWLSDEVALAAIKTSMDVKRRSVANKKCVWNYNIGFEIAVTAEDAQTARPITERTYNLDNPPELRAQDGPGKNAVVLLDTTWKENPPRPYAFSFVLDKNLFFIKTTGVKTTIEGLRAAANEIAEKFPSAPNIDEQHYEEQAAFDPCSVWSDDALKTLFDLPSDTPVMTSKSATACTKTLQNVDSARNKIAIGFNAFKTNPNEYEALKKMGRKVASGFPFPSLEEYKSDQYGTTTAIRSFLDEGAIYISVNDSKEGREHPTELKKLASNLMSRITN